MGEIGILGELIEKGGDPCCYDMAKRTPLHYVSTINVGESVNNQDELRGRMDCLLLLIDAGAGDVIDDVDSLAGDTALMAAARSGWTKGVRTLLETAANCSIENR